MEIVNMTSGITTFWLLGEGSKKSKEVFVQSIEMRQDSIPKSFQIIWFIKILLRVF